MPACTRDNLPGRNWKPRPELNTHAASSGPVRCKIEGVSWTRYEGRALADVTLTGAALFAELEDYIRLQHLHFTDVRMGQATATEVYDTTVQPAKQWYQVTYFAEDPAEAT
jgi:hypothetical protein